MLITSSAATLIVGFERSTEFVVWRGDRSEALRELNEKVERGEPIGLAGFDLAPGGGVVRMRPLGEYANEEWIDDFLNALSADVKLFAEHFLGNRQA